MSGRQHVHKSVRFHCSLVFSIVVAEFSLVNWVKNQV
jgi:hypothetical protein